LAPQRLSEDSTATESGGLEVTAPTIRYGVVFFLLTAIYLCASAVSANWMTPFLMGLAATLVLVLAIPTRPSRHHVLTFMVIFLGATVLSVILANISRQVSGISDLIVAALLIFSITIIARVIVQTKKVTVEAVIGAVDMYILLGLAFGFIFSGLERLSEVVFFTTGMLSARSDFLYFAFVAITTLGFGDLAPADNYARPLVVLAVLTGQIVLVVVVARVVSMLGPAKQKAPSNP
jgi:voltage-gated potassium channel